MSLQPNQISSTAQNPTYYNDSTSDANSFNSHESLMLTQTYPIQENKIIQVNSNDTSFQEAQNNNNVVNSNMPQIQQMPQMPYVIYQNLPNFQSNYVQSFGRSNSFEMYGGYNGYNGNNGNSGYNNYPIRQEQVFAEDPLKELASSTGVTIVQEPSFCQVLTGCPIQNKFTVYSESINGVKTLFKCKENSSCLLRPFIQTALREFKLNMRHVKSSLELDEEPTESKPFGFRATDLYFCTSV